MKERLVEIMCCPLCRGDLRLAEADRHEEEIRSGRIECLRCAAVYPIKDYIPVMLTGDAVFQSTSTVAQWGEQWLNEDWIRNSAYYASEWLDLEEREWNLPPGFLDGKRLLDVGCGNGRHSLILSRYHFAECVAFDLSNSIEYMRRRPAFRRIHLIRADMARPPLRAGYFDFVLARQVLQHSADPRASIASLARLVRPGGHFVSSLYKTPERLSTRFKLRLIQAVRRFLSILPRRWIYYFTWLSIPCYRYRLLYPLGRLFFLQSRHDTSPAFTWNLNHDQYITSYQYTFTRNQMLSMLDEAGLGDHLESQEWENLFRSTRLESGLSAIADVGAHPASVALADEP